MCADCLTVTEAMPDGISAQVQWQIERSYEGYGHEAQVQR